MSNNIAIYIVTWVVNIFLLFFPPVEQKGRGREKRIPLWSIEAQVVCDLHASTSLV